MSVAEVETKRETIRRLFEAVSAGEFANAVALFTDDAPVYSYPGGLGLQPCRGKPAIEALYEKMSARFTAPLQFVPRHIVVEGNRGVIEWDHSATTRAGNTYRNSGVHVVEFAPDGRIAQVRCYLDTAPVSRLNQLERPGP